MRPIRLVVKITAVFLIVLAAFVVFTLHLFSQLVMDPMAHGTLSGAEAHNVFVMTVLQLMLGAMVVIALFAIYITAPLRRMSRSMDRIAAGELDHRVPIKGRDEVAMMGRSFNSMAERVRSILHGQKELMAGVSHELRTPLTRMKLSLELLRREQGDASRIQELESEVDALDALVEELLLASRLELGAQALTFAEHSLSELCKEAWKRVELEATETGASLDLQIAAGADSVLAHRALAVRIFGNLFENGVRYAVGSRLQVVASRNGDRVHISVRDQGPGVKSIDLEHLFEPFYRADASRSRSTGATGLGLMIVKRAVETHGGSVTARNLDPGMAIEFDLAFPVEDA